LGALQGSNRVQRGGSWNNNPQNCRVANRNNNTPDNRNNNIGFRLLNTGKRTDAAALRPGSLWLICPAAHPAPPPRWVAVEYPFTCPAADPTK
jgi:hypothetical protein